MSENRANPRKTHQKQIQQHNQCKNHQQEIPPNKQLKKPSTRNQSSSSCFLFAVLQFLLPSVLLFFLFLRRDGPSTCHWVRRCGWGRCCTIGVPVGWIVGCIDDDNGKHVHPRKLTWNLKRMVSKRNLLLQGSVFRFHVSFRRCTLKMNEHLR